MLFLLKIVFLSYFLINLLNCDDINKRAIQKEHEKNRMEKLSDSFLEKDMYLKDTNLSLINLLNEIAETYLFKCYTIILYDDYTKIYESKFLSKFFYYYPLARVHGAIPNDYRMKLDEIINKNDKMCVNFIIFIKDIMKCQNLVSKRSEKIIIVANSSQWKVQEFLHSKYAQEIENLLIIVKSDKVLENNQKEPYILYSHKLFVDALGSSAPIVLTSWNGNNYTKNLTLFKKKITDGFSGHRFTVAIAHQPPYVIKKAQNDDDEDNNKGYKGIEIKLLGILSEIYNFSLDYKESGEILELGSREAVIKNIKKNGVDLGIGGIYITESHYNAGSFIWHSEDCAAFISLASTALPRYRAIMGPFRWSVWTALIAIYLGSIPLFYYTENLSLQYLIENPAEIENMFWYVFGTFTNCFSFTDKNSWAKTNNKGVTKLLIGTYWLFTIIITACYTGSIIAFVTLPIYPTVIDTVEQLEDKNFDIGMLDKAGWPSWFHNLSDKTSRKLLKKADFVSDITKGLKNVTKAFFWPYAFLSSRDELEYIVKNNFSISNKKSLLHISQQCFVSFKVAIILPSNSVYNEILSEGVQRIFQSGLMVKIKNDVEWEMLRSTTGNVLAVNSMGSSLNLLTREDRALTFVDTQGMFLLLGAGFLLGGSALLIEIFGGCFNFCKKIKLNSSSAKSDDPSSSIMSYPRFYAKSNKMMKKTRSQSLFSYQRRSLNQSLENTEEIDKIQEYELIKPTNNDDDISGNLKNLFGSVIDDNSSYDYKYVELE